MKKYTFNDLVDIIAQLRGENGCPWDREQTVETLKPCLLDIIKYKMTYKTMI